nr:reverse transcriptase domain-containing protein [Tanacetum cinerariifolium]
RQSGDVRTLAEEPRYFCMGTKAHDWYATLDQRTQAENLTRYSPVWQKKHGQAPEHAKAILEEVHKLVDAGIMREVYFHDWLCNPVMVKKSDGSWRMCVDFTDLNKACPQDCYPLPEIDWKVESCAGTLLNASWTHTKGY